MKRTKMEYMRTSLAFVVFWANLLFSTLNLYFSIKTHQYYKYLRKVEIDQDEEVIAAILIFFSTSTFMFIIVLGYSFFFTGNECCIDDENIKENFPIGSRYGSFLCCGNCDCACQNDFCNLRVRLFLMLITNIFSIIYFSVKACGKHISRMVAIIPLILINLTLFALSVYLGRYIFSILLSIFSIFAAVGNFLAILLPNLENCKQLSYDNPNPEEKIEQMNQSPQKLIIFEPQKEKFLEEEAYPEINEVMKEPISKPITPNYIEETQGNDDNSNRSSIGAPAPAFLQ